MIRALAFFLAVLPAALSAQPPVDSTRVYGPRREFTGVYVTNFEIAYFVECEVATGGCERWVHEELRWLKGASLALDLLMRRCVARWNGSRDRWALFAIRFEGRETLDRRPEAFLHDTERYVVHDTSPILDLIGTDQNVDYELPRYRRRPTLRCAG